MTWERRWHPLREEWVTVTSHRNRRPWSSGEAAPQAAAGESYRPDCYLCPGNARVSGECNPGYKGVYVFDNDHPSFAMDSPDAAPAGQAIFRNAPARGRCRVVCYSPDHQASLATLPPTVVEQVMETWAAETESLLRDERIASVAVFENKGEIVGVSNPHPHGQIYAADFVFDAFQRESAAQRRYLEQNGNHLFDDLVKAELADGRRLVVSGGHSIAFVPYFARFPYEVYVAPKRRVGYLFELSREERAELAAALGEVVVRYDNLWQTDFPYILMLHQSPRDGGDHSHYHFHIQIHPLMRAPNLQKFLAGIETGAGHFLNDGCPEEKAAELRSVSDIHYRARQGCGL